MADSRGWTKKIVHPLQNNDALPVRGEVRHLIRIFGDAILIDVKAVPGASKSEIAGIQGDRLRMRVAAAPEDGKANAELIAFFSKLLGCPKKEISLVSGEKSRLKTLAFPLHYKDFLETIMRNS